MKKLLPLLFLLGILLSIFWIRLPKKVPKPTVDFSYYTKREESPALYTRLSPEPLGELMPSEDYGTIYPFVGGEKNYLSVTYGDLAHTRYQYGFVDATGRIIVDPVYDTAELLRSEDGTALPFWVIGKIVYDENLVDSYALCALASIDGSYVGPFAYTQFRAYEDFILAELPLDWQSAIRNYHVLDHTGRILWTTEDLDVPGRIMSMSYCGEGLFHMGLVYTDIDDFHYRYMDLQGNFLPGHYITAEKFSDGWAAVQIDRDTWTYIDPTGKEMGQYFTECTSFQKGYALIKTGNTSHVIRPDGTVVLTRDPLPRWAELTVTSHGLYIYALGDVPHFYYSFEGELLYETTHRSWLPEELIYADYSDLSAPYLYDIRQDRKIPLPPMEDGHRLELSTYGDPDTPVIVVRDRNYATWEAIDSYYSADYTLLWVSLPYRGEEQTTSHLLLEQVGKEARSYPVLPGETSPTLYGATEVELKHYSLSTFTRGRLYDGGYLSLTDDFCTRMYDPEGALIFSYPFTVLMED